MKTINLGCGFDYQEGAINVDSVKTHKADIYFDLNEENWPNELNEADVIKAYHVLEHVKDIDQFLLNCYLKLKKGGVLEVKVPCGFHSNAIEDPSHIHYFVPQSFRFFESRPLDHYHPQKPFSFKVVKTVLTFENKKIGPLMYFIYRKLRNRALALSWVSEFHVEMQRMDS